LVVGRKKRSSQVRHERWSGPTQHPGRPSPYLFLPRGGVANCLGGAPSNELPRFAAGEGIAFAGGEETLAANGATLTISRTIDGTLDKVINFY
jgi:hypothetical protein